MTRIGYDADTVCYYFRDQHGLVYKGPEGSEFGELVRGTHLSTYDNAEGMMSLSFPGARTNQF